MVNSTEAKYPWITATITGTTVGAIVRQMKSSTKTSMALEKAVIHHGDVTKTTTIRTWESFTIPKVT